ncbi:Cell cycle-associated protein Mob1-1 [Phaffia rhodozyma]|uniref:Cell cycle-associated protein Mob1-1 n=1 Tax=Phaffia rhodozyma TaxID=264483 RepID=A0A0F7SJ51_PHARH|nr:Cell cycle-associated protein Mob1-1 [Phaffia rhodozyma]
MSFLGRLRAPKRSPAGEQPPPQNQQYSLPLPASNTLPPRPQQPQSSPEPLPLYLSQPFVRSTIITGNFKTLVTLPKYVDPNEWVGVNIFDFFNNLNYFYGVVSDYDTPETCPTMMCGPGVEFTWVDNNKRSVRLPAPTYIDYVFTWVQGLLDDENTFPTKTGREYPPNFASTAKHIYRQLLRVFAHIYHAQFPVILHLSLEAHWNALFAHFLAFGKEYDLLDLRDLRNPQGSLQGGVAELAERWREMRILDV